MREHGILNRLLLIYQEIANRIENNQDFSVETLAQAAKLTRDFLENYHEKLEEEYIFPLFVKADQLVDLVHVLKDQHDAGRKLTDYILSHPDHTFAIASKGPCISLFKVVYPHVPSS